MTQISIINSTSELRKQLNFLFRHFWSVLLTKVGAKKSHIFWMDY